uniref:Uncharacterized protein n=1 Tax=Glossina palpalis gambiensis TaxID=67801 RepID=A0A1B0BCM5_9MUSC
MKPNISYLHTTEHSQHMGTDMDLGNRLLQRSRKKRSAIDFVGRVHRNFQLFILSNHYATQLTELATIKRKLEVIKAGRSQHRDSANHDFNVASSALIISAVAIITISGNMMFLKKTVIAHITAAPNHDIPQHEATPTPAPCTSPCRNFIFQF